MWGHWVRPLSGSSLLIFSFCCLLCFEELKQLSAPAPAHVRLADSSRGIAQQGPESSEVKDVVSVSMLEAPALYLSWSLVGAEAWQSLEQTFCGQAAMPGHVTSSNGRGALPLTLGKSHSSPGHNSVIYIMSTYIIYFLVLS